MARGGETCCKNTMGNISLVLLNLGLVGLILQGFLALPDIVTLIALSIISFGMGLGIGWVKAVRISFMVDAQERPEEKGTDLEGLYFLRNVIEKCKTTPGFRPRVHVGEPESTRAPIFILRSITHGMNREMIEHYNTFTQDMDEPGKSLVVHEDEDCDVYWKKDLDQLRRCEEGDDYEAAGKIQPVSNEFLEGHHILYKIYRPDRIFFTREEAEAYVKRNEHHFPSGWGAGPSGFDIWCVPASGILEEVLKIPEKLVKFSQDSEASKCSD